MPRRSVVLRPGSDISRTVETETRKIISSNIYLSRKSSIKSHGSFEFGVCNPKIVVPRKGPPLINYVCIDGVFSVSVVKRCGRLIINCPDRNEIANKYQQKRSASGFEL
jgi:hypothetical protein